MELYKDYRHFKRQHTLDDSRKCLACFKLKSNREYFCEKCLALFKTKRAENCELWEPHIYANFIILRNKLKLISLSLKPLNETQTKF